MVDVNSKEPLLMFLHHGQKISRKDGCVSKASVLLVGDIFAATVTSIWAGGLSEIGFVTDLNESSFLDDSSSRGTRIMHSNGAPFKRADEKMVDKIQGQDHQDAVHPLFTRYRHQLADAETSTSDDLRYFCKECDIYFPLSLHSVVEHFETRAHMPIDSCVYCSGPVCEYFYNNARKAYHNCGEIRRSDASNANTSVIGSLRNKISFCDVS